MMTFLNIRQLSLNIVTLCLYSKTCFVTKGGFKTKIDLKIEKLKTSGQIILHSKLCSANECPFVILHYHLTTFKNILISKQGILHSQPETANNFYIHL